MRKHFFRIIAIISVILISGCGESAKDRQAREEAAAQQLADSIARIEAQKVKEAQERADSLANAEKRRNRLAADSVARTELLPLFDEIANTPTTSLTTYRIKTAPKGHRQNSAYLSFYVDNGMGREMQMNIDYAGPDWIHLESADVDIDGENFNLTPQGEIGSNFNNDTASEWFTATIGSGMMDKIAEAKTIKISYRGERTKQITLTPTQVKGMAETVRLYRAFGG